MRLKWLDPTTWTPSWITVLLSFLPAVVLCACRPCLSSLRKHRSTSEETCKCSIWWTSNDHHYGLYHPFLHDRNLVTWCRFLARQWGLGNCDNATHNSSRSSLCAGVYHWILHLLPLFCGWAGKSKYCPCLLKGKQRWIYAAGHCLEKMVGCPPHCERTFLAERCVCWFVKINYSIYLSSKAPGEFKNQRWYKRLWRAKP